ncbi:MAG: phosphotransferase [Gammaproteobacteria bacterium]|nr:phosphotransferase [Gammaproteobacteria bacterium]
MPQRLEQLTRWLQQQLGASDLHIESASADASFRRYFRVSNLSPHTIEGLDARHTLVAMDAPPDKEDTRPFLTVASLLSDIGLHAPRLFAADVEQGFLLLEDMGQQDFLDALDAHTVESLYGDALDALLIMQRDVDSASLPPYDESLLLREMQLFTDWYLQRYRGYHLDEPQRAALTEVFGRLAASALAQPRVFVHRDYHSRNLMVTPHHNPGIIDFQDAVRGPVTYDLVSLLRDCYVQWPREQVERWALDYLQRAAEAGVFVRDGLSDAELLRWFDWMGVQRHLKAAGIFARLWLRDGKRGYLNDIPRTLGYVYEVSARYPELSALHSLLVPFQCDITQH